MRFYTKQHQQYCGIDLHTKTMYICIIDADGFGDNNSSQSDFVRILLNGGFLEKSELQAIDLTPDGIVEAAARLGNDQKRV